MKKLISQNKKTRYDYFLSNPVEAGMVFTGVELKNVLNRGIDLTGSYVEVTDFDVYLLNATISVTNEDNNIKSSDLKLLMHKAEIKKLKKLSSDPGCTLLCTNVYIADNGKVKCTVEVGRGKKSYDKRNTIKERDLKRDLKRIEK